MTLYNFVFMIYGFMRFRAITLRKDWDLYRKEYIKAERASEMVERLRKICGSNEEFRFIVNYIESLKKEGKDSAESILMGIDLLKSRKEFRLLRPKEGVDGK